MQWETPLFQEIDTSVVCRPMLFHLSYRPLFCVDRGGFELSEPILTMQLRLGTLHRCTTA